MATVSPVARCGHLAWRGPSVRAVDKLGEQGLELAQIVRTQRREHAGLALLGLRDQPVDRSFGDT
jgi:hypothetical protein